VAEPQEATGGLSRGGTVGRYIVLGLIGHGAMGVVYAAYDPELDRKVALKLLRVRERGPGGNLVEKRARLLREAKAMARLSHPNVIVVYDVGAIEDQVFIAMELVDGVTVGKWREGRTRNWKEVVGVFSAAGQALAAAHTAGLVHRDFKPDNVMVGRDGKVRVMDFGLARQVEHVPDAGVAEILSPGSPTTPEPEARLTHEGMVVGTPAYMPPEQYLGQSDARTDQFSFCVAFYECLYGEYPFEGRTAFGVAGSAHGGRVREAPQGTRVPLWLRKVVLRGLRPRPEDRHPSMQDLLAALGKDPAIVRRRWLVGAGAVAIVAAVAAAAHQAADSRRAFCDAGPARVAAAWEIPDSSRPEGPRHAAVRSALEATGKPYAPDTVRGVFRILDDYATRWTSLYRETCEATHVRGDQSEEVLDLRMACLNDRLSSLKALTDLFAEATGEVVERAIDASHALTPLDGCSDVRQLRSLIPPPEPAVKARVEALRRELGRIKALQDAGRHTEAVGQLKSVAAEARSLAYRPLLAEVMTKIGISELELGNNAEAEAAFEDAVTHALASRHDDLIAELAGQMVWVVGFQERFAEADRWTRLAEAAIERTGKPDPIIYAWLLNNVATIYHLRGRYVEALEYNQRARALKEKTLGPENPDVAYTLGNIGLTLSAMGRGSEALAVNDQALHILRLSLGASHPRVGNQLNNRGEILTALGRLPEALSAYSEAQSVFEQEFGPTDQTVAYALTGVGSTLVRLGRYREALSPLERALIIRQERDPDQARLAETEFALAQALWEARADHGRALDLARRALARCAEAPLSRERRAEISAWLARHDGVRASRLVSTTLRDVSNP
jgi:tetratricopeptide (TPR) repeat protein